MVINLIHLLGIYCLIISILFFVFRYCAKKIMRKEYLIFKKFYAEDIIGLSMALVVAFTLFSVSI